MPRELSKNDSNKVTLVDGMTGERFWLTHKTVTTDDRIAYSSASMNILTTKSKNASEELIKMQLEWGRKFLTSIQPDYFEMEGKPITDKTPGWKDMVSDTAADVLIGLVKYLFGESTNVLKDIKNPFAQS